MPNASLKNYIELLRRNADFRNLWFGQVVSLLGDWFNLIASATLLTKLSDTGSAIGVLFVVRMLAPFLVSPVAGVVADLFNRKHLLILTDIVRAVVVIGFLLVRGEGQVWLLYLLTFLQLGIAGFFFPARNAILPSIVARSELGTANALSSVTWSVMLALGTALGGVVTGGFGVRPAFIIDSVSFLVSAFFILIVRYSPEAELLNAGKDGKYFRQYVDGLRYLKRNPDIFAISLHKAAVFLFLVGAMNVVLVVLAEKTFVTGEGGGLSLGLIFAAVGVGTGVGPIVARFFTGDREKYLRKALFWSYVITSAGVSLMAPLLSFPILLIGTFIRGCGSGIMWVFSTQLLLQLVPNEVRGRVFAMEFAMFTLMAAISSAVGGWLIDNPSISLSESLWWMTGTILLPGMLWWVHDRISTK